MTTVAAAAPAVAASGHWIDGNGVRQPGGEVHAWFPRTNQTLCGRALSRTALRGFPRVRFDFRSTDSLGPSGRIGWICPRCMAVVRGSQRRSRTFRH